MSSPHGTRRSAPSRRKRRGGSARRCPLPTPRRPRNGAGTPAGSISVEHTRTRDAARRPRLASRPGPLRPMSDDTDGGSKMIDPDDGSVSVTGQRTLFRIPVGRRRTERASARSGPQHDIHWAGRHCRHFLTWRRFVSSQAQTR